MPTTDSVHWRIRLRLSHGTAVEAHLGELHTVYGWTTRLRSRFRWVRGTDEPCH